MKTLNEYLSSKVKVNKANIVEAIETILKYFGIGPQYSQYQSAYDCVHSWCAKYVTDEKALYPMCSLETLNDFSVMSDEFDKIKDKYNTSYIANEICQDELNNVKKEDKVWIDKKTGLDIYCTQNMIACLSTIGTIYVWNKKINLK